LNKAWYPFWAWEHWQHGFFGGPSQILSVAEAEDLRMEFFREPNLFEKTALELFIEWPVCVEHFMTDQEINRVAWLGQVSSFYCHGLSEQYSYVYNKLQKTEREKNNKLAKDLINEWETDRNSQGSKGIYQKVETERLREGYTSRVPAGIIKSRASAIVQGNLFGHTSK
jgi:hypothetical protein